MTQNTLYTKVILLYIYIYSRLIYPIVRRGPIKVTTPFHLSTLDNKSIIDIVVGGWSFHALDTQGHVWTWGAVKTYIILKSHKNNNDTNFT